MKKIQIEKIIKKFEEFTEEQQEQIINNYRYINIEDEDFSFLFEQFLNEIKELNIDLIFNDIVYSISDYGRDNHFGVYSKKIVNQLIFEYENKGVYDIDTTNKIGSFTSHLGGGICRKNTTEYDLAKVYFEDETTEEEQQKITQEINERLNKIITLCSEYYNKLTDEYNYLLSDESIKETLIINEYDFDEETLKIY